MGVGVGGWGLTHCTPSAAPVRRCAVRAAFQTSPGRVVAPACPTNSPTPCRHPPKTKTCILSRSDRGVCVCVGGSKGRDRHREVARRRRSTHPDGAPYTWSGPGNLTLRSSLPFDFLGNGAERRGGGARGRHQPHTAPTARVVCAPGCTCMYVFWDRGRDPGPSLSPSEEGAVNGGRGQGR